MIIKEIHSKSILSVSRIHDYVINPYVGCQHGCRYCYARFIKKFSRHPEPWGEFVDVKMNAAELLSTEIKKKKRGNVWVSGLCDPYQPLESTYQLTRKCLEILADHDWHAIIQTRSSMVLRDLDVLKKMSHVEVGLSITTADDSIRKLFEPDAPPIKERLNTLNELHHSGLRTFAMIAPILPGAELLAYDLEGKVDYVLLDRMNYHYADWIYKKYGLAEKSTDEFFHATGREIEYMCRKSGIDCSIVY